jgi:hypothetical protein
MTLEKKIVTGLMKDLNGLFDLGLGTDPKLARKLGGGKHDAEPAILVIGSSNRGRTADEFEVRGYSVTPICTPGWKPTTQSVQAILPEVSDALKKLGEDDIILMQALDKAAFFSQT